MYLQRWNLKGRVKNIGTLGAIWNRFPAVLNQMMIFVPAQQGSGSNLSVGVAPAEILRASALEAGLSC